MVPNSFEITGVWCRRPDATEVQPFIGAQSFEKSRTDLLKERLFVDVSAMTDRHHDNQQNSIVDGVHDAIITDSESISITPSKRPRGGRARIYREK